MCEVVLCPPKAAVDVQQTGTRSLRARQTYFKKLIRVGTIRYTRIGRRLRVAENVFGGHGFLSLAQTDNATRGAVTRGDLPSCARLGRARAPVPTRASPHERSSPAS